MSIKAEFENLKYHSIIKMSFYDEDKETIVAYIKKYCPDLQYEREYIETKLKPILDRIIKTDPAELNGLFWPCFNERYDQQFCNVITKKGLKYKKCTLNVCENMPYDTNETYDYDDVKLLYQVRPGMCIGYMAQEVVDDTDYFRKAAVIMDDLYKSSDMDGLSTFDKKKVLMSLMRYIDSTRSYVEKTWPRIPVTDELLSNLQNKYDAYDELYDTFYI